MAEEQVKEHENGLVTKWGNEIFDDGVMNAPLCVTKYGYRFMTGGEYAFVMTLMSYKYDNRNPFPSQEKIAKDMGVQRKQIERWVDSLFNKKGLINIYERRLENGTRTSNEYDFAPLLEKCLAESKKEKAKSEPKMTKTKRKRKTEIEETALNIPPTKCRDGEKPHKTYPLQNVGMDTHKNVGVAPPQNVGKDYPQNVRTNKESEESKLRMESNNPNLNHNHLDIYDILWNTDLPHKLKVKIKILLLDNLINLSFKEIMEIDEAYQYQKAQGYIIPDTTADDIDALNDFEFTQTISKMLLSVKDIKNMKGLIQSWVKTAFSYKRDANTVPTYSDTNNNSIFYNWLEEVE